MKNIFKVMMVMALTFPVMKSNAQTTKDSTQKVNANKAAESYVILKDGKVLEFKNAALNPLTETYVCTNGDKVATDGTITKANGSDAKLVEGEKILLYENGVFLKDHMKRALVCEEDLMQGVRKSALTEDMSQIKKVYIERNGEISAIKK